jgi:hypothetical protein
MRINRIGKLNDLLEPDTLKVVRPVLRGERSLSAPDLPDSYRMFRGWV